jgi:hypothetical protein
MSTIELVRDRPPAPPPEPRDRDERAAMRAFIQREHERTDLVRLRRGLDPLYVEEGDCSPWVPTGAASTEEHGA